MQKISVYIPDDMKLWIGLAAKARNEDESEIVRKALCGGLQKVYPKGQTAKALLELAHAAESLPMDKNAVTDLSENHDYYAWGGKKK
jgi:peptidyl-tRNA hydrolase